VFYLTRPDDAVVQTVLARANELRFNFDEPGGTREGDSAPPGYVSDRYGCELGRGDRVFRVARAAIETFRMYPAPWTDVISNHAIDVDAVFVARIRHLGIWSLNPCRIIDVVDEPERYGFAFRTLRGHAERGEERFEVVWDRASDAVAYRVAAFSRPAHLLARIGSPIARAYQLRFQRESCEAMRRINVGIG